MKVTVNATVQDCESAIDSITQKALMRILVIKHEQIDKWFKEILITKIRPRIATPTKLKLKIFGIKLEHHYIDSFTTKIVIKQFGKKIEEKIFKIKL